MTRRSLGKENTGGRGARNIGPDKRSGFSERCLSLGLPWRSRAATSPQDFGGAGRSLLRECRPTGPPAGPRECARCQLLWGPTLPHRLQPQEEKTGVLPRCSAAQCGGRCASEPRRLQQRPSRSAQTRRALRRRGAQRSRLCQRQPP